MDLDNDHIKFIKRTAGGNFLTDGPDWEPCEPTINFSILQKKQKEKICGTYRKYRICTIYQLCVPKEIFNWINSPLTTSMFWFIDHKHLIITLFDKKRWK